MDAKEYQELAARTECDQEAARMRMAGYTREANQATPSLVTGEAGVGRPDSRYAPIRLNHGALGIAKECGELLRLLEKWIYYGQTLDVQGVKDELGDICWYLALASNAVGLDVGEIMQANIRKLAVRYPERYSDERAAEIGRNRDAERAAVEGSTEVSEAEYKAMAADPSRLEQRGNPCRDIPPPKLACRHCEGGGKVNCEWSSQPTECPTCKGTGERPV